MDIGGMEKKIIEQVALYQLGAEERADDVPAKTI